ncbi:MAG TPA: phosphopantetheine-binding protein, partial [Blastocatellia bacterium]|nr:phosphopantetheine-binding protein [Blastocatellia bacterium]
TSWEHWQEDAMASSPELQSGIRDLRERFGITPQEAVRGLDVALALERAQVIVSARDFLQVLKSQSEPAAKGLLDQIASIGRPQAVDDPSSRASAYVAPEGEIEQAVALIWRDVFGIEQIGANDDFFNMGGNSLVAIQVISRLRKELELDLPMSALFENPTISSLSAALAALRVSDDDMSDMEQLLAEVEGLTPEEVAAALAKEAAENG